MRAVISAPVGRRDVYGRMLAPELGIGKASALLPVTMPTHRAQNLHKRKGRPQSHSPSKDSDRELERGAATGRPLERESMAFGTARCRDSTGWLGRRDSWAVLTAGGRG